MPGLNRRGFLSLLAGLPFLGWLAPAIKLETCDCCYPMCGTFTITTPEGFTTGPFPWGVPFEADKPLRDWNGQARNLSLSEIARGELGTAEAILKES